MATLRRSNARRQKVSSKSFPSKRYVRATGYILLDEPFAGVDPIAVEDIQHIVAHLKDRNIGILITDHNVHETLSITDRAYLLFEGSILKQGTAQELADDPEVRRVYLGQNFELRKFQRESKG